MGRLLAPGRRWVYLAFFFFAAVYLASMGGQFYSHDDSIRFRLVQAMVDQGSLVIGAQPDGSPYYCKYGLLQPVLSVPLYVLGQALTPWWHGQRDPGEVMVTTLQQILTAVTMLLLLLLVLELGYGPGVALAFTLVAGLATINWPYAKFHFTEPLNGLCLVGAFWCLVRAHRLASLGWLAGAGGFLALGGINAFLVLVLGGGPGRALCLKHSLAPAPRHGHHLGQNPKGPGGSGPAPGLGSGFSIGLQRLSLWLAFPDRLRG